MLDQAEKLLEQGKILEALPLLVEYSKEYPQNARSWFLLGACHHQNKELPSALQNFEKSLALEPSNIQARSALGTVLCDLGRFQEALKVFRKALQLAPKDARLMLNMGIVLDLTGDKYGALERYDLALKHHPEFEPALLNRGELLIRMGRLQEALCNNIRQGDLFPHSESAQFNLGEVLLTLGQWQNALAAYERALAINPKSSKTYFAIGLTLSMLMKFDKAQQAFDISRSTNENFFEKFISDAEKSGGGKINKFSSRSIYLLKKSTQIDTCDWSNWTQFVKDFESIIVNSLDQKDEITEKALLFKVCSLPVSAQARLALAKSVSKQVLQSITPLTRSKNSYNIGNRKPRIGYVSPDFRQHPIAILSRRLYALHNRDKFEIYGYSLHSEVNSPIRQAIEQGCDTFRELSFIDDQTAAEVIQADDIDILIDLAGYTTFARPEIFAMRPAKLQVSYLGFPHTTGASYIDYFIGDQTIIKPEDEQFFSEKIAYLPCNNLIFDNQQIISSEKITRESLGLPAQGIVFCCHNSHHKITPDVFDSWMRILRTVPGSVIWLKQGTLETYTNLYREAGQRGVSSSRLIFSDSASNDIILARYRLADLFLDTFHFNAISTGIEALWAGLPILSCMGNTIASRSCASMLNAVGLNEMITTTPEQYEEKAIYLATHPEELARIRTLLEHNRLTTPLFNTEQQVKNIEAVYEHIWERHRAGLPPETLHAKR